MTGLHELAELRSAGRTVALPAGRAVFSIGDPVEAVHVVESGVAWVRSTTPDGDAAVVDVRSRGDLLDDTALLADPPPLQLDEVVALTDCRVLRVPRHAFDALRRSSAAVGSAVMAQMTDQARRLSNGLVDQLGRPARARAARRLLDLADALERSAMPGEPLRVTQHDLAELVGTTRSTLNALLRSFQEHGALSLERGRLSITDAEVLRRLA